MQTDVIPGTRERVNRFCRRHPLFVVALVVVCCVIGADRWWWLGAMIALGSAVLALACGNRRRAWCWLACGLVAVTVFGLKKSTRSRAEQGLVGTGDRLEATILADGKGGGGNWSAPARLRSGPWRGTKVWWEGHGETPVAGARVSGAGNFLKLREPRNPEEFDEADWLRRRGVVAIFRSYGSQRLETGRLAALGAGVRSAFRQAVTAGLEEDSQQSKVIRAIVIGEAPPDADELVAAFRNSGTLHIFSVSGMHVAMVGSIAWLVLRALGVSRRWAVVAILPLIFGYSWITGNSPPAVRSAWMLAVYLMAFVFRRQPDLLNALGAVLLAAMLWDGNLLFQPGVQLSYGVVAAIAIGTAAGSRMFVWMARKEEYLPDDQITGWRARWLGLRKKTAAGLGVSTAAWVGSTPLTIYHFGLVTPVALIATGVLGPLVYALLSAALLSAVIHPVVPQAAIHVNRFNGMLADWCVSAAAGLSSVPGAHFSTKSPGEPMLLIYDLNYGAGAACFSGGKEGAVLIDCGDRRGFRFRVARSLRGLGIEPDSVILTHPDGGHLGGGADVWEAFPIRQALLPVEKARSPVFRQWVKEGPPAGIRLLKAKDVGSLPLPAGARLEVIYVPDPFAQNVSADGRVAIFRIHWQGWRVLFTSDAGIGTETKMLESGKDLSADVIVAGRHATEPSLDGAFLDAVMPKAIVASHADFPTAERLAPRQVDYWKSRGISVIHQGEAGGVILRIDENGDLLIQGHVDGSLLRLKRR